jgi:signal transduction histidine kinase
VADNGTGMTKEVQAKLFGRFFSTKGGKGTGLGLLVTRKVVTESAGTITFTSEPCKGTVFSIRFPRKGLDRDGRVEGMLSGTPQVSAREVR